MRELRINEEMGFKLDNALLSGFLKIPDEAMGLVLFAHGSGSSRFSPRNSFIANRLLDRGIGTFLFDLLTEEEDIYYGSRFNIDLIASRLIGATKWMKNSVFTSNLNLAYFGASTGAAAALKSAAFLNNEIEIKAIVSRGGRPDMSYEALGKIVSPTLLIVGELDYDVLELNKSALESINAPKKIEVVSGATHLFEEKGSLQKVADLSVDWFKKYLQ